MSTTKVLVVDDSAVFRGLWSRILKSDSRIEVVTAAIDGNSALEALKTHEVDVVLLDIEMPGLNGLDALPLILQSQPKCKVIMVSSLTREGSAATLDALARGASDFLPKPKGIQDAGVIEQVTRELIEKVLALGGSKGRVGQKKPISSTQSSSSGPIKVGKLFPISPKLLLVGCSTGGPNALSIFFRGLRKIHVPILVVQHMPPEFTRMLSERIGKESGFPCKEAVDGEPLQAGSIYIAPGDYHMRVVKPEQGKFVAKLNQEKPEHFCRPAVDQLFRSAAEFCQKDQLALILTGMGEDGKLGCQKIKEKGGMIIVQDEGSSVVWGMPGAVAKAGLADAILPLDVLAERVSGIFHG